VRITSLYEDTDFKLKVEREEFLARAQMTLGDYDKVIASGAGSDREGLKTLALAAEYYGAVATAREPLLDQIKSTVAASSSATAQLVAAQVFLDSDLTKEALQCVISGSTMEQQALTLQIYLKIDRPDLAQQTLSQMKRKDEDAILTQICGVLCALASGSNGSGDALHSLKSLMEQYGPSPMLLNLMACAYMQGANYAEAEKRLEECLQEFPDQVLPDTLINLVVCCQHQGKPTDKWMTQVQSKFPNHKFSEGVARVQAAFDREMVKYRT